MHKDLLDDRFGRFREIPLALALRGHQVHGLCLSYEKKKEEKIRDDLVEWESINAGTLKIGLLRFIKKASQIAKKVDAIWACSDSFYGVIGCAIGWKFKIPVIFDIYDNFDKFFVAKLPVARQLYHWAIQRCDAITTFSHPFARLLKVRYNRQKQVAIIENGVRYDLFRPLEKKSCRNMFKLPLNSLIVGTAGALYKRRNSHLLFDAFFQLKNKYPNLHLTIAGPRDHKIEIPHSQRIHDLGLLPFEKVPNFINALDIAVICYGDDEFGNYCFPQKTWEIMACDTCLIAARVGSLKDLFEDRQCWLFTPDDADDLARVLENRLKDRRTGYSDMLSWSDVAIKLEGIFLELCRDHL